MGVVFAKAVPEDAAELIAFLKQVGGETDNLSFGSEGLPFTPEAERDYIERLQHSQDGIMLVAKEKGRIIGNASMNRLPRRMGHRGEISVVVAKSHWGKGVGRQLLYRIIDYAKENRFEIIELQVRSDNLRAIRLYEGCGFEKLCTYPAFMKVGNNYADFEIMILRM